MARGDQLARQWMIIQTLISSKRGRSAGELARELEINPRTVYRDLEALQAAGFPIYTDKVEGKSLWSFLDVIKHQIPIPFTLMELMALYFSSDMMKVFRGTVFYESLESLFKKVRTTLPPESIKYLDSAEQTIHISHKPHNRFSEFKEIINRINQAALQKKTVDIVYFTMSRKKESRRLVDPYKVWFFGGTLYLIGKCHNRNEVRIFALDRIKMLHITEESFQVPEDFSLDEFMNHSFGVFKGEPCHVRVWFHADIAGYIKEKVWVENQEIVLQEDGSIIFQADVAGIDEIKFWIMSWGAKAEVLEPESLREEVSAEAESMVSLYGDEDRISNLY